MAEEIKTLRKSKSKFKMNNRCRNEEDAELFLRSELNKDISNKLLVCMGSSLLAKGTLEYENRRKNNNEAVKRCRKKRVDKQQEKEQRIRKLEDENGKLMGVIFRLKRELNSKCNSTKSMSSLETSQLSEKLDEIRVADELFSELTNYESIKGFQFNCNDFFENFKTFDLSSNSNSSNEWMMSLKQNELSTQPNQSLESVTLNEEDIFSSSSLFNAFHKEFDLNDLLLD